MRKVNNYIILVIDTNNRQNIKASEEGVYRVGAKTEKEAIEILKEKLKSGIIQAYYRCKDDSKPKIDYGQISKEFF